MAEARKKGGRIKKVLLVFGVVLIAAGAVAAATASCVLGKIGRVDPNAYEALDPQEEYFEPDEIQEGAGVSEVSPEDVSWGDSSSIGTEDLINILLIGQDRREGETRSRSDSMILVSIHKKTGRISMTSFMRDLYVQIPGYSDNRINAAYVFGGMKLLDETIEKNFGVSIDGNLEVDFEGFQDIIGVLGGVDIDLSQEEADYLNLDEKGQVLKAGVNHLTAEQALRYSRIRYLAGSDFGRIQRQQKVLLSLYESFKNISLTKAAELINEFLPFVTTDMTNTQMIGIAALIFSNRPDIIETYRIPADGAYYNATIRGMMVLVPDLDQNRKLLKEYLFGGEEAE